MDSLTPRDDKDIEDAIKAAIESSVSLAVQGSGRHEGVGHIVRANTVLDLAQISGIVMYEPDELVMAVKAATPLSDIVKTLDEAGQMLAFDPPFGSIDGDIRGTIGGVMAVNLSGSRRLTAGAARDYLLGFKAISGRGEAFQSGGRVVKNVTGYDLSKLMAGSYGTLAVMHELTFKTMPKFEDSAALLIAVPDYAAASQIINAVFASPFEVAAAAIIPPYAASLSQISELRGITAAIRIEGLSLSIESRLSGMAQILAGFGDCAVLDNSRADRLHAELREAALLPNRDKNFIWKLSCPPASGGDILAAIDKMPQASAFADWGGGLIWVSHPPQNNGGETALRQLVSDCGGHATLIHAPDEWRDAATPFHPQPPALAALSKRIKANFDPFNVLNPGRIYKDI